MLPTLTLLLALGPATFAAEGQSPSQPPPTAEEPAQAPQEKPAPAPSEKPPPAPGEKPAPPSGQQPPSLAPGELNFELLPPPEKKGNPELDRQVETRRELLTLHQGVGFATWATLAATVVVGQLDFNDRFRGGGDTGKYHGWHTGLAYSSAALFAGTAALALLAPKPYPTPARLDTAMLHKIAMGTAAVGMVTQIVLGITARGQTGSESERHLATAHQIVGYATFAAFTTGVVVFLF